MCVRAFAGMSRSVFNTNCDDDGDQSAKAKVPNGSETTGKHFEGSPPKPGNPNVIVSPIAISLLRLKVKFIRLGPPGLRGSGMKDSSSRLNAPTGGERSGTLCTCPLIAATDKPRFGLSCTDPRIGNRIPNALGIVIEMF